jgi:hypothetical protein
MNGKGKLRKIAHSSVQGGGEGVRLVGEPFLAGFPPHYWSSTAQVAYGATCRGCQGEAA